MAWSTDPAVKQSNGGSRGAAAPAGNPSNVNNSNAAAGGNLGPGAQALGHYIGLFNESWSGEDQAILLAIGHDTGLINDCSAEDQAIPEESLAFGHDTDELSAEEQGQQAIPEESLALGHDTDELSAEDLAILKDLARGHDAGLFNDGSTEKQAILEEGLAKYASEQTFVNYSKIARQLSKKKKIRDVAMRCSWMTKMESEKRRKEDLARKSKEKKDRVTDPSPKPPAHLAARPSAPPYGLSMLHIDNDEDISYKGLRIKKKKDISYKGIGGVTGQLLGHNTQIQDNLILFCHARDNLLKILNDMNDEPEIMKQMLPLLEKLNEELANFILTGTTMLTQTRRRKRPHADSSAA